jgi:hypothetical protein
LKYAHFQGTKSGVAVTSVAVFTGFDDLTCVAGSRERLPAPSLPVAARCPMALVLDRRPSGSTEIR